MISIQLWRARIGLYNCCRRFSSTLSSLFSPSRCSHAYYQHRKRRNTLQEEKPQEKLTDASSAPLFLWSSSLRPSFFRDVLIILVIAVVSQQLVISGDVEINPGPRASDPPTMRQLVHLDGTDVRVIDSITSYKKHKCVDFAHMLLGDDQCVKKHQSDYDDKEDFVREVLSDWLSRGDGKSGATAAPCTWEALAECVNKAGLGGKLANSIRDACSSYEDDNGGPPAAKKLKLSPSSEVNEERVQQLQEELKAANRICQEKDQKISQLEAEITALRSNLTAREKLLNDTLDDVVQHAQKLKEKALLNVEQNPDTGLPTSPSPLDNFTTYLKDVYLTTKLRHAFLEPNDKQFSPPFNIHECFAHECCMFDMTWTIGKLSTIDIGNPSYRLSNLSDGRGVSQSKLTFSPEPAKNIVVVHPPGVGASLLCHEWAKGELLQRWPVVICVQLHEKVIREDKDVLNLVYHPKQTVREAVVQKLVESKGRKVLFILDGYDQLSGKQKQACFVFHELVTRKHFPQATLMVLMSQRSQDPQHDQEVVKALPEKFHQKIDQYIKILKFSDDDVHQYATDICNDDHDLKSALNSFLSSRSFSYFQLYTPLQCTILTDLYCFHWKNGDKSFAPRTRTELYTDLVHTLLVQYLSSHSKYSKREWHIVEFTNLPGEVYEQFEALAQLAARGIQERVYVFDDSEVQETLGLMHQVEVYPGRGRSVCSFLHLTLQEYLAAYYCSLEKPEDRLKRIIGLRNPPLQDFLSFYGKKSLQYHWQVLLFTVGITKLSWNTDDLQLILQKHDRSHDRQAQFITGSMCLLYETQSPVLIQSSLSTTDDKYMKLEDVAKTPDELFVAGYCVPHSNRSWVYSVAQGHFQDLFKGLSMSSTNGRGKIVNLTVTAKQLNMLLAALIPFTNAAKKIAKVTIWDSGSHNSEYVDVSTFSSCFPHLEELEVSADISDLLLPLFIDQLPELKSLQKLIITFKWQTENLSTVCEQLQTYQIKHLEIKQDQNHSTSFSFRISSKLEFLSLSHVTLTPELARCIGMEFTALHTLELHNCNIPDNACSALIVSLKSPHCVLEKIELSPVISNDVLKALGSSSSFLKQCILTLDYTSKLPHLISGLKGNETLEELTVLHVHRSTRMPFMSNTGLYDDAVVRAFEDLIRMVDEHTSIWLLTVSSRLQGFVSVWRKTLKVKFVD